MRRVRRTGRMMGLEWPSLRSAAAPGNGVRAAGLGPDRAIPLVEHIRPGADGFGRTYQAGGSRLRLVLCMIPRPPIKLTSDAPP